jgi:hypothetical protein
MARNNALMVLKFWVQFLGIILKSLMWINYKNFYQTTLGQLTFILFGCFSNGGQVFNFGKSNWWFKSM